MTSVPLLTIWVAIVSTVSKTIQSVGQRSQWAVRCPVRFVCFYRSGSLWPRWWKLKHLPWSRATQRLLSVSFCSPEAADSEFMIKTLIHLTVKTKLIISSQPTFGFYLKVFLILSELYYFLSAAVSKWKWKLQSKGMLILFYCFHVHSPEYRCK